ncbi:hypothetical protein LCGC14_1498340, partial [marine sediment metagenome]
MKIHKSPKIKNLIILILILTIVFNITVFSGLITYNFTKAEHPEKRYEIYNPKISGQEINITTPENKTYFEPMNGYYPATYGFENDLVGNNPDNWIVEESGGTVNIISNLNGHKNIVEIHDISSVSTTQAENKFSNTVTGIIEFWIRLNATDKGVNIWIGDEEGPNNIWIDAVRLFFEPDGWIKYQDSIMNNIMTYNADYWYHIRVDFNCSSQTFDLYIDNELKVNDGGMGGDASHLDTINFNTYTPSDDYYVYFDAVGYSWDPNYAIGDNLNEGLLVSFENNTNLNWIGYSLDGLANKTIIGNTTISFPTSDGSHTIQIIGNDTSGIIYQSEVRHFRTQIFHIITPENKTYIEPMSGYFPATNGFENEKSGITGTSINFVDYYDADPSCYAQIQSLYYAHKNVLELRDDNTGSTQDVGIVNAISTKQDYGTIEFWVSTDDASKVTVWTVTDDYPATLFMWRLRIDGDLWMSQDSTGWVTLSGDSPLDNTWHHIRIDFRDNITTGYMGLLNNYYRITIDGVGRGSYQFVHNNAQSGYFSIASKGTDGGYSSFTDAIGYSWDPNYNIGDNLKEGLLVSFENNTNLNWIGYSLDGLANKTIIGNTTISFPTSDGSHTIQLFGNDSLDAKYESDVKYFTINTPPTIAINSPSDDEYFGNISPNFNVSVIDLDLNSTWYTLDGGIINITFNGLTGTIDQTEWDKLSSGTIFIRFYANDSWGLVGYAEITVQKNIEVPIITINSPNSGWFFGKNPPTFDISVNELNLSTMWYTLDGGLTNTTFLSFTGTIDQTEWDKLSSGTIFIRFYVNDSWGLVGYAEITVQKDIDVPIITINSPNSGWFFGEIPPTFDISVNELNLGTMWYTLDGGLTNTTFLSFTGTIDQTEWDKLSSGTIFISFYANDSWGLVGYAEITVQKDIDIPLIIIISPLFNEELAHPPGYSISIDDPNLDA